MNTLHLFGVVLLGAVFAVSSWSKVRDAAARRRFVSTVRGWELAPGRYAGRVAGAVVTAEIGTTVLLLASAVVDLPWFRAVAGGAAIALLVGLTAGLAIVLRRGVVTSCACFGASPAPVGVRHVARNAVLLALAVVTTASVTSDAFPSGPAAVYAVGLAAVGALLVTRFDDVVDLFTTVPTTSRS